jgi:dTDP-glucose 4,6-dehydratase
LKPILVTGGAGFIGSNFVLNWLRGEGSPVINLDKLTYAGNLANLASVAKDPRHIFVQGDIADRELVSGLMKTHQPRAIIHFAAESHVDRSIHSADDFIHTNIEGTFHLLQVTREYVETLSGDARKQFRFLHISTDEVYGSLGPNDPPFTETTQYAPNSPYAASKASADHMVRAFHHTHGLPVLTTNCSNNYGPYQFPEKMIPLMICNGVAQKRLPVYGDGMNIRDWLHVDDHCAAVRTVLERGVVGETYNIGGNCEKSNLDVVHEICAILAELRPGPRYESLIEFVKDRPGHDRRYAVDTARIRRDLGWSPQENFTSGLRKTVAWYLENQAWIENVTSGAYRDWLSLQYK